MISILLFALMQAAPPPIDPILMPRRENQQQEASPVRPPSAEITAAQRLLNCVRVAASDPDAAIAEGARWALTDGGIDAELCLGVGYENASNWAEAESAYMRAHTRAEVAGDTRTIGILANAGRMALRAGDADVARDRFIAVLADPNITTDIRGNMLLERAQANVALEDGDGAQADLVAAQTLLPNDSSVWLLSATLARRQGNLDEAGDFIDRALELDQSDPSILLEAGNIAIRLNAYDIAEQAWGRAAAADPDGAAGQAATRNMERLAALLAADPGVPVELPETDPISEEADPEG